MRVQKLTSTDAFVVFDIDDADRSVGVVRLAPKVLVDGAELLARATTYSFAFFGIKAGGASAGINATPEDRDDALTSFMEELTPHVADGRLHLSPSTGVTPEDLAPLGQESLDPGLAARGAVAAAAAFVGGGSAAVTGGGDWSERLSPWWADVGGSSLVDGGVDADVDVLFVAGKAGVVDHDAAATVRAKVIVPVTPVPVTAKAYAVLRRAGRVYVPDAVSCAAPLLAVVDPEGDDPVERVAIAAVSLATEGVDAWRASIDKAEAFLTEWQGSLPFGRPLA